METTHTPAGETATDSGGAVKSTVEQVKHEGQQIAETARANALRAAEERKSMAAGFVRDICSAVHKGSEELRSKGREQSAEIVDRAAGELDRFCGTLSDRGIEELWSEMEDFARRRPALFFGAALLAGFGAVRFAMSSRQDSGAEESASSTPADPFASGGPYPTGR